MSSGPPVKRLKQALLRFSPVSLTRQHEADVFSGDYHVTDVGRDGNCMFAALALSFGEPHTAETVRRNTVQFLKEHKDEIAGLPLVEDVDKSIDVEQINDQYFERMAKSGEFGDGTILAAACRLFHRLINVVLIDKRVIKFAPPGYDLNNAGSPLWLGFIQDGKHYVKLSPKLPTNTVDSSPQAVGTSGHESSICAEASVCSTPPAAASTSPAGPITASTSITTASSTSAAGVIEQSELGQKKQSLLTSTPPQYELDIGLYCDSSSSISQQLKLKLLTEPWTPSASYVFPTVLEAGRNRRFNMSWFSQFPWLTYSAAKEGAFCKHCVLFATRNPSCGKVGAFVETPLQRFKRAVEFMRDHEKAGFHQEAMLLSEAFARSAKSGINVINLANTAMQNKIAKNRQLLTSVVQTILLCGRQNIALRGHRDDGKLLFTRETSTSCNQEGTFRELLRFRVQSGDTVLASHFSAGPGNATMISKTTQNDLIQICGQLLVEKIVAEVKEVKYFAIQADETTDVSTKEQVSLLLRYATKHSIAEAFVGFMDVTSTTGCTLADALWKWVSDIGLDPMDIRGQGYDGASNMSGSRQGVQALIMARNPQAVYTHCCSHVLNLVIVKSCSLPAIRNMFGTVQKVAVFFGESAKRMAYLETAIDGYDSVSITHKRLKKHCQTRWVEQADALLVFLELYDATVDALRSLALNERDTNTSSAANVLHSAITEFSFIVAVAITSSLLNYTKPLSVKLQQTGLDLCKAMNEVNDVMKILQNLREKTEASMEQDKGNEVDDVLEAAEQDTVFRYDAVYQSAVETAARHNTEPSMPRLCAKQVHRSNAAATDPKLYYRQAVYFPFLDHLLQGLHDRFGPVQQQIALASKLVPAVMVGEAPLSSSEQKKLVDAFPDMPSPQSFAAEYHRWFFRWKKCPADAAREASFTAFLQADDDLYPNIHTVLLISATRPSSTAGNERSFSALKRLKTYLRSTMTEERLTGLALMHIHRDVHIDAETVIDRFSQLGPHRLAFL